MSNHYLTPAWKVQGGSLSEKLVLVKLADQANDEGVCWPSVKYLMRDTGLGKTALYKALACLEQRGLIERLKGEERVTAKRVKSNNYQLHMTAMVAAGPAETEADAEAPQGSASRTCGEDATPQGSATRTQDGPPDEPQGSASRTQTLKEPSEEPSTRARVREPGAPCPAADGDARGAPEVAGTHGGAGETAGQTNGAERQPDQPDPSLAARYREALVRLFDRAARNGDAAEAGSLGSTRLGPTTLDPTTLGPTALGPTTLGRDALLAWVCALVPEAEPDDPHALRLLCPGEVWRQVVARWRSELAAASGRRIVLGLLPEEWGRWCKPGKPHLAHFEPAWVGAQRRAVRHLVEARLLPPELAAPVEARGGRPQLAFEAAAALERASRIWAAARPALRAAAARGALDAEGADWLLQAVAPLRLGRLDAAGPVALDLAAPGQDFRQQARDAFADRQAAVEAALAEAWGVPVPVELALARRAEERAAEAALAEIVAAEAEAGEAANEAEAEAPTGVSAGAPAEGAAVQAEPGAPDFDPPEPAGPG